MLRLFCIIAMFFAPPAWSQSGSDAQRALSLGKAGFTLYKSGQYAEALEKFKAANALRPNPTLDVNIGKCHERLGQLNEALLNCKIALNARRAPAAVRKAARACLDRVEPQLKRPELSIVSEPDGARVSIDGNQVGKTPWSGAVDAGRRQIDLDLPGYRPYSRSLVTALGQAYKIRGRLLPGSLGALLSITSVPEGAAVSVDGAFVGVTPLRRYPLQARTYNIEVAKDGFVRQVVSMGLLDGSHLERTFILVNEADEQAAYRQTWPGWTLVGIGVAAASLGTFSASEPFWTEVKLRNLQPRMEAPQTAEV